MALTFLRRQMHIFNFACSQKYVNAATTISNSLSVTIRPVIALLPSKIIRIEFPLNPQQPNSLKAITAQAIRFFLLCLFYSGFKKFLNIKSSTN